MPNRSFLLCLLAVLLLSACATTQYYWHHNQLTGQGAQQQFVADRGTCTAAAYRAVGAPPASQIPPDTVTTFSGYTSSGGYMYGQAHTTSGSLFAGPAEGFEQAQRENQYRTASTNVFNGCMAQRGWTLQAVTR